MISAFPKIFAIGSEYIPNLFDGEVEVTEKVDGSQFSFGVVNGELQIRSKGAMIQPDYPPNMFELGVKYVLSIQDKLVPEWVYYCEFLNKPKHNVLKYNTTPKNNLVLFGVHTEEGFIHTFARLITISVKLGISIVPLLYQGVVTLPIIKELLERESFLGGPKIEGVVVKNYNKPFLLGGQPIPIMMGKYVSEAFKEVHRGKWAAENTGRGKWEDFKLEFKTSARWEKAVQHLKEKGELENHPRDIGKLMKEVNMDIISEEKDYILNFLWKEFGSELLRRSTGGLAEWYKNKLLEEAFTDDGATTGISEESQPTGI
jgi:hypothetical protein